MTTQSQPSISQSPTDGRVSSRLREANRKAVTKQRNAVAQRAGESILNLTAHCLPSDARLAVTPTVLYSRSCFPQRHTRVIDDSQSPAGWVAARDKVASRLGSGFLLALLGNRGTGKTQMAQYIAMATCTLQRSVLYARAMTFFLELRATFTDDSQPELSVIQKYQTPRLLIIDEVQERGESEWENRILAHLMDLRYGDMRDTLLIGNQTPGKFRESVGDSIADRLRETGGVIECTWESFRQTPKTAARTERTFSRNDQGANIASGESDGRGVPGVRPGRSLAIEGDTSNG